MSGGWDNDSKPSIKDAIYGLIILVVLISLAIFGLLSMGGFLNEKAENFVGIEISCKNPSEINEIKLTFNTTLADISSGNVQKVCTKQFCFTIDKHGQVSTFNDLFGLKKSSDWICHSNYTMPTNTAKIIVH